MSADAAPLDVLLGVAGLALLRHLHEPDGDAGARIAEIRELLAAHPTMTRPAAEADARRGYASWSGTYDEPGNPIVELEQPLLWSMLAGLAPGVALDAACGTGRHTRRLVDLGHTVTGVDLTPAMLARARVAVPEATFAEGDLRALPVPDASVDVLVCGLALAHLPDPAPAVAEFARVLAPGGHALVSSLHPMQIQLGWHATFADADGRRGFVREHPHGHAVHLRAFRKCGLEVLDCAEPLLEAAHVAAKRRVYAAIPRTAVAAYAGLPAVLIWHLRR